MVTIAEALKQLIEVPAVFLWVPELGARGAGLNGVDSTSPALSEYIQAQILNMPALESTQLLKVRSIQLSREFPFGSEQSGIKHLTAIPLTNSHLPAKDRNRSERDKKEMGWILTASSKPIASKEETLLIAAAQHLMTLSSFQQLSNELSLRDQFLSIASHELKTPLTSIYGILQLQERMLRAKPGAPFSPEQDKQRSFFKIVIRQVERLNELIDGLLDVSRIQNGRFMVEPGETDVSTIARETIDGRLQVLATEAGVKINLDAPETLNAWVDPVRFEEVVTNLTMNAIRFSPEGGVVWVKLREDQEGLILSVRDQGPSVPEADRSRIFQPFERAQRTSRLGGLGLGLFISRQIAQLHQGNVTLAESLPGKGNVLEAHFPMKRGQQSISA